MSLLSVQTDFDFLVPNRKELLRVDEVAEVLRFDVDTVYNMILSGELEEHRRTGSRSHKRVTRRSLIVWLAKSASYEPTHIVDTLAEIASTLTRERRRELAHKLLQS